MAIVPIGAKVLGRYRRALFLGLTAFLFPLTAVAQIPGGGGGALAIGQPVTGCASSGFILYNNAGALGCQAAAGGGNVSNTGTPALGQLASWTNATTIQGLTTGTGVLTALGVNTGSAGAFVVNGGALGTPASGTGTNLTGIPISTGISGLATGVATFLATPTSANLAAAVTNETGTGLLVFATNPVLTTPNLGTPSAITLTNGTGLPIAGITGLGTGVGTFLATPTSANLAAALTDETGTGANVFATGPTLSAPVADRYLVSTSNINSQTGTTYTVVSGDCGKTILLSNAAAIAVSVNTGLTGGCWLNLVQTGAGQVTVGGTATLHAANGLKTRAQYSMLTLAYMGATDTYVLGGDTTP